MYVDLERWSKSTARKSERADTFLDTIGECEESFWLARVLLLGRNITFKLDIGAEVTAISFDAFQKLGRSISTLGKSSRILYGPGVGQFVCDLTYKRTYSEPGDLCCMRAEDQLIGTPNFTSSESDCQS